MNGQWVDTWTGRQTDELPQNKRDVGDVESAVRTSSTELQRPYLSLSLQNSHIPRVRITPRIGDTEN